MATDDINLVSQEKTMSQPQVYTQSKNDSSTSRGLRRTALIAMRRASSRTFLSQHRELSRGGSNKKAPLKDPGTARRNLKVLYLTKVVSGQRLLLLSFRTVFISKDKIDTNDKLVISLITHF